MRVAPFAIITGLLPLLAIHVCYWLAASAGHVDWCNPYWDSCTSISATGRQLPEKLLFKMIMIPTGLMAIAFWWLTGQWLRQVQGRVSFAVPLVGAVAGCFLMLYVVALGEGREYQALRKIGIVLFFSLTYLAQLIFLWHCHAARTRCKTHSIMLRTQLWMAVLLLLIGVTSVVLDLIYAGYDRIEDAFEWVMMLFIAAQFISHYWLWRATNLQFTISCAPE